MKWKLDSLEDAVLTVAAIAAAAVLVLTLWETPPSNIATVATLTGYATAADGDDLRFGDVRVRLAGIAAPEDRRGLVQPGGPEATAALARLVEGRRVTCHLDGSTAGRSLRPVATCRAGGADLGWAMVQGGWARDCPAHSGGRYAGAEAAARVAGLDLAARYALPGYCGEGE